MDENPYKAPKGVRFSLRALLIAAALVPPMLAGLWWGWLALGTLLPVIAIFALPPLLFFLTELQPLIPWLFKE